jgi:hypothetical protein
VETATGAEYDREFGLTLGRMGLTITRWGLKASNSDDADDLNSLSLKGVRKVQIGVYEVKNGTWDPGQERFDPSMFGDWEPLLQVREDGEEIHVMLKLKDERVRDMLVLVSDKQELVIVRMKGKLDRLIEDAIRFGLDEAESGQHYDAAVAELHRVRDAQAGEHS